MGFDFFSILFLLESVTLMVILENKKVIYENKIKNKNKKMGERPSEKKINHFSFWCS
jgi:uncharacterized protein YneF (UPF0154 family)